MNAYTAFKMNSAIQLHFRSQSYDFFKYEGITKQGAETFEKKSDKEKRLFLKLSRNRNPYTMAVGNAIFNKDVFLGAYDEAYQRMFEKFLLNGQYLFSQDLNKLKPILADNFSVDEQNSLPYILSLLRSDQISIYTCCVFEQILNCDQTWSKTPQFIVFSRLSNKIRKIAPFFNIETDKYIVLIKGKFPDQLHCD